MRRLFSLRCSRCTAVVVGRRAVQYRSGRPLLRQLFHLKYDVTRGLYRADSADTAYQKFIAVNGLNFWRQLLEVQYVPHKVQHSFSDFAMPAILFALLGLVSTVIANHRRGLATCNAGVQKRQFLSTRGHLSSFRAVSSFQLRELFSSILPSRGCDPIVGPSLRVSEVRHKSELPKFGKRCPSEDTPKKC
jgi:hypothetical protein